MFFNVTALLVAPVAQVLRSLLGLIFTLTTSSLGAKVAKPFWKICKPFARPAILENPMCTLANNSSLIGLESFGI
jgi:hypothetical protein